jgi:hypothetical protein
MGIYVTTKVAATPSQMVVRTPTPGWDAQVFAVAGEPPSGISGWGREVGSVRSAAGVQRISLGLQHPARHFLLWFRKAPPTPAEGGGYAIEISNIKLLN